jgi:hypothetical protein
MPDGTHKLDPMILLVVAVTFRKGPVLPNQTRSSSRYLNNLIPLVLSSFNALNPCNDLPTHHAN